MKLFQDARGTEYLGNPIPCSGYEIADILHGINILDCSHVF